MNRNCLIAEVCSCDSEERGSSLVEFALSLILLLLLLFAGIEFAWRIRCLECVHFFTNESAKLASRQCGEITFSQMCLDEIRTQMEAEIAPLLPGITSTMALYQVGPTGGNVQVLQISGAGFTYNFPATFSSTMATYGTAASPNRLFVAVEAQYPYSPLVRVLPKIFEMTFNGTTNLRAVAIY